MLLGVSGYCSGLLSTSVTREESGGLSVGPNVAEAVGERGKEPTSLAREVNVTYVRVSEVPRVSSYEAAVARTPLCHP